jgi:hypothetical protein
MSLAWLFANVGDQLQVFKLVTDASIFPAYGGIYAMCHLVGIFIKDYWRFAGCHCVILLVRFAVRTTFLKRGSLLVSTEVSQPLF